MGRIAPMISSTETARFIRALPYSMSLVTIPLAWFGAVYGGWWLLGVPVFGLLALPVLDSIFGINEENADPETPDDNLSWYRLITLIWVPIQFVTLFGALWYVTATGHLGGIGQWLFFALTIGVITGAIGINYSHELMHQSPRIERYAADLLLAMVAYSHFRSEHLLVHHRYVGTPKDAVTARYNEGFHRFFRRVLRQSLVSAFNAERELLARKQLPWYHHTNPFWRYWALQISMIALAAWIAGWFGVWLFFVQAFTAVLYLELVNYMEHYGLTRKHLGDGKYEHVKPRHSWNAAHKTSNWFLINLQRHSDHHYKPSRRFPLLQTYPESEVPQLPIGYPAMGFIALIPPIWRRVMNPRVRTWRKRYYPEIEDWQPYSKGTNPMPVR